MGGASFRTGADKLDAAYDPHAMLNSAMWQAPTTPGAAGQQGAGGEGGGSITQEGQQGPGTLLTPQQVRPGFLTEALFHRMTFTCT